MQEACLALYCMIMLPFANERKLRPEKLLAMDSEKKRIVLDRNCEQIQNFFSFNVYHKT